MNNEVKPPRRSQVFDLVAGFSRALHLSEIASRLGVQDPGMMALSRIVEDLVFDGQLTALPGNRFRSATKAKAESRGAVIEGFLTVNPRGFGFIARAGDGDDVFVPAESMRGAMHGDKVRARIVAQTSRGAEGSIDEILDRKTKRIAGALQKKRNSAWLMPDDQRVRGPVVLAQSELVSKAEAGDIVVVEITRFPDSPDENPEGKVIEVLGESGTPDVEVKKILLLANVNEAHAPAAVEEAKALPAEVPAADLVGRVDLTEFPLPTIDPEDARDHDDAIWALRLPEGGYRVIIAIADVSHYVRPGTAIDDNARDRGCSIYLPDRAIPMLPRELSSNLCSLLPDVVRLCLAVDLTLDATGTTKSYQIVEGFMNSRAKLSYDDVALAIGLTNEGTRNPKAEAMKDDLAVLREISSLLRGKRMARGALDFDLPETKITVDPKTRLPISAVRRGKDPGVARSYQIVEELMLLANETIAAHVADRKIPAIYRNHGVPDPERVARFAALCTKFGVTMDPDDATDPKKLSAFVKKLRERNKDGIADKSHAILDSMLVRTLKQAVYDVANIGHFGLASTAYLHFTSPIRRYPDLVVHRMVRAMLQAKAKGTAVRTDEEAVASMRDAAILASERERRAMQVERDVVDLYGVFLMREVVGDVFAGTVTSIVGSGVFVSLFDPFVSVLVKMEMLGPDDYEADDDGLAVSGKRSGDRIDLGDTMHVEILEVSFERRMTLGKRLHVEGEKKKTKAARKGDANRADGKTADGKSDAGAREGGRKRKSFGKAAKPTSGGKRREAKAAKPKKKDKAKKRKR